MSGVHELFLDYHLGKNLQPPLKPGYSTTTRGTPMAFNPFVKWGIYLSSRSKCSEILVTLTHTKSKGSCLQGYWLCLGRRKHLKQLELWGGICRSTANGNRIIYYYPDLLEKSQSHRKYPCNRHFGNNRKAPAGTWRVPTGLWPLLHSTCTVRNTAICPMRYKASIARIWGWTG